MPTTNDKRPTTRIGYGFDSHEFRPGIPLKIGGVSLAHDKGLGGHSDIDASLILAAPKIGPHTAVIRERVAKLLGVAGDCVGLKAKTPEGLNLENTALAHVVVLLEKIPRAKKSVAKKRRA
jgi:2C-methyl-D-erythritol 2,4-cyclodiphosphate synthase